MKIILTFFILMFSLFARAQTVRFNGVYESKSDSSISFYLRFYPDGVALQVVTESDSKELIRKWFNYENRKNQISGFFFFEKNTLIISANDPYTKQASLEMGEVKNEGAIIELAIYSYSDGMVKKSRYQNSFIFKPFD